MLMASLRLNPRGFCINSHMAGLSPGLLVCGFSSKCSQFVSLSLTLWWQVCCAHCLARVLTGMAPVVRVEPHESTLLESNADLLYKVREVGWLQFLCKFSVSNPEVTRVFAVSLRDYQVEVGDLCFRVDERSVAHATGLPLTGQKWFKYQRMEITEWHSLLKNPTQEVSFRIGVSRKYFRKEWRPVLDLIHRYITCEGRFSSAYVYHLRLMAVFLGFQINLPYYLLHSLFKMSNAIKKGPKHLNHSLFHHGLIRILVENELGKTGRSWEQFIEDNGFSKFCHCMYNNFGDCGKHKVVGSVSPKKPVSNPSSKNSEPSQTPVVDIEDTRPTPVRDGCRAKSSGFSPVTPSNTRGKIVRPRGNPPDLGRRLTRSMARAKFLKGSKRDKMNVETVVIDIEEITTSAQGDDDVVYPDLRTDSVDPSPMGNSSEIPEDPLPPGEAQPVQTEAEIVPDSKSLPVEGKKIPEAHEECVTDSVRNEKSVKTTSSVLNESSENIHPLFVNCLLDKVRRMEERIREVSASRDLLQIDNIGMKEKIDDNNKHLVRLKCHKNKLIRRVLKLQDENERNEEKLRELNAQIALMQFKTPSPSHSSGVNIQVFGAPVNI